MAPLNPLTHLNTGYEPLPPPLGLAPYHYDLSEHFPEIIAQIGEGPMVCDVLGDSGGVQDAEFQSHVADRMVEALSINDPQFCYHVGDAVYYTGAYDDYYFQFYEPYEQTGRTAN